MMSLKCVVFRDRCVVLMIKDLYAPFQFYMEFSWPF